MLFNVALARKSVETTLARVAAVKSTRSAAWGKKSSTIFDGNNIFHGGFNLFIQCAKDVLEKKIQSKQVDTQVGDPLFSWYI